MYLCNVVLYTRSITTLYVKMHFLHTYITHIGRQGYVNKERKKSNKYLAQSTGGGGCLLYLLLMYFVSIQGWTSTRALKL